MEFRPRLGELDLQVLCVRQALWLCFRFLVDYCCVMACCNCACVYSAATVRCPRKPPCSSVETKMFNAHT